MPSNLNNIKLKDVREFGLSEVTYKDFTIVTTETDEIVCTVLAGDIEVTTICGDTLNEAKKYLQEELNDITLSAEEIIKLGKKYNSKSFDYIVYAKAQAAKKPVTAKVSVKRAIAPTVHVAANAIQVTNKRGKANRTALRETLTKLGYTNIVFSQRSKYNGWYIACTKNGTAIEQRLDVFKKKLGL